MSVWSANRAAMLQLASVAASAASAILAKHMLASVSLFGFVLIFSVTSVAVCVPWVDRGSLRLFLSGPVGWSAIASNTIAFVAFYVGLEGLDPGTHAFLSRSYVAFAFLFSYLIFREPFGMLRTSLALLCVLSALLSAAPSQLVAQQDLAVAATVLAACLYALNYALLRMTPPGVTPATAIALYNAALVPIALSQVDLPSFARHTSLADLCASVSTALLSVLSMYWYVATARCVTFFVSTALRATSPFIVSALALPWFPMRPTATNLVGILAMPCILTAIAVAEHRGRKRKPVSRVAVGRDKLK